MAKPTGLVKCSSRLLDDPAVLEFIRYAEERYALRFVSGGGEQISDVFNANGWPVEFGPFGRICRTFDQRLAAENVLKKNAAAFEDRLHELNISSRTVLPVFDLEVGGVTCHVNGDLLPVICYNGYDRFFVLTKHQDVERKRWFYRAFWQLCRMHLENRAMNDELHINSDYPEKIEVVGF